VLTILLARGHACCCRLSAASMSLGHTGSWRAPGKRGSPFSPVPREFPFAQSRREARGLAARLDGHGCRGVTMACVEQSKMESRIAQVFPLDLIEIERWVGRNLLAVYAKRRGSSKRRRRDFRDDSTTFQIPEPEGGSGSFSAPRSVLVWELSAWVKPAWEREEERRPPRVPSRRHQRDEETEPPSPRAGQ
jgi:hypothetical protein